MPVCDLGRPARQALAGLLVLAAGAFGPGAGAEPLVMALTGHDPARVAQLGAGMPETLRLVAAPDGPVAALDALAGAEAALARAAQAGWDLVALDEAGAMAACRAGLIAPASWAVEPRTPPAAVPERRPRHGRADGGCALAREVRFEALAYRLEDFPVSAPETALAFFDTAAFPGVRAVAWPPRALLEWAIMAEGVPPAQVYDILSTPRGLRLARARIAGVSDSITWVQTDAEAAQMLASGAAAMAVAPASELAQVAGTSAIVLREGRIGARRAFVHVPRGGAMGAVDAGLAPVLAALLRRLSGGAGEGKPTLWRDAAWYARAGAHVAAELGAPGALR